MIICRWVFINFYRVFVDSFNLDGVKLTSRKFWSGGVNFPPCRVTEATLNSLEYRDSRTPDGWNRSERQVNIIWAKISAPCVPGTYADPFQFTIFLSSRTCWTVRRSFTSSPTSSVAIKQQIMRLLRRFFSSFFIALVPRIFIHLESIFSPFLFIHHVPYRLAMQLIIEYIYSHVQLVNVRMGGNLIFFHVYYTLAAARRLTAVFFYVAAVATESDRYARTRFIDARSYLIEI